MNASQTQENTGVAAVDRAFAIVQVVAQQTEPISLADLSRATGFYKSTLLRLIVSLEKASLVVRRHDGRYVLGPYAYELGRLYQGVYRITEIIQPILERLVQEGSESSSFHVYNDSVSRMCVLRIDSNHSTLDSINEGDLLPLGKGAAGKLISLFQDADTIPRHDNVFALSMGERDPACAAVACAVFGAGNEFVGAISLSGPKGRFSESSITKMTEMVRKAAQEATQGLGGHWPDHGALR